MVLDAGAGESRHRSAFSRQRYVGVDLAIGDPAWNYHALDAVADLERLPFHDGTFDAALNIVTLEHVRHPDLVLAEIGRVLKPGAALLLITPLEWEEHQAPHDYFRFTRHSLAFLLREAGFRVERSEPAGGIFRLLSRRMLNVLATSWLAGLVLAPAALLLPLLDGWDKKRTSTLGYVTLARRLAGEKT